MTPKQAFEMGKDYTKNGSNKINCNYKVFATKENLVAWIKGKNDKLKS